MSKTTKKIPARENRRLSGTDRFLLGESGKPVDVAVDVVPNSPQTVISHNLQNKSDFDTLDFYLPLGLLILIFALQFMGSLFWSLVVQFALVQDLLKRIKRRPSGRLITGFGPPYASCGWGWAFAAYAIAAPFLFAAGFLNQHLLRLVYPEYNPFEMFEEGAIASAGIWVVVTAHLLAFAFIFFQVVIFAPISEEMWFRGIGLASFLKNSSQLKAVILTSVIFGALHGPGRVIFATLFGFVMAFIRFRTGSLYCCMVVHAIHNFLAILVFIFMAVKHLTG